MLTSGAYGYIADYVLWCVIYVSFVIHAWCFFRFLPREKHRKFALVTGNALVFVCMVGTAALVGESYFRFVSVETDAFGMSLPARRWFAIYAPLNSLGCRDVEWTVEKPPGVRRIAFVGDSFTYGWGIERVEDTFPGRIQGMFSRQSPGAVQVMNVAKPGWDSGAQIQPVKDMIDVYGVDEIVLCYVLNDIEKLLPRTADFDPIRPPEPTLFNPYSSCLLEHLYYRVWVPRVGTVSGYHDWLAEGFADEEMWRRHQQQLYAMIRHCQERNVTFRAVLLPFIHTGGGKYQADALHAMLRHFFETNQVDVVDLLPVVVARDPAELVVNNYDAHPNELAHQLFAEAIRQGFYSPITP
jgi:lysophospholipase L1-like esterase